MAPKRTSAHQHEQHEGAHVGSTDGSLAINRGTSPPPTKRMRGGAASSARRGGSMTTTSATSTVKPSAPPPEALSFPVPRTAGGSFDVNGWPVLSKFKAPHGGHGYDYRGGPKVQTKKTKNLKQILAMDKAADLPLDQPTFFTIDAPPSLRPQKKYCDVTGLIAPYTDPKTGLRFHDADVYKFLRQNLSAHDVHNLMLMRRAAVDLR